MISPRLRKRRDCVRPQRLTRSQAICLRLYCQHSKEVCGYEKRISGGRSTCGAWARSARADLKRGDDSEHEEGLKFRSLASSVFLSVLPSFCTNSLCVLCLERESPLSRFIRAEFQPGIYMRLDDTISPSLWCPICTNNDFRESLHMPHGLRSSALSLHRPVRLQATRAGPCASNEWQSRKLLQRQLRLQDRVQYVWD